MNVGGAIRAIITFLIFVVLHTRSAHCSDGGAQDFLILALLLAAVRSQDGHRASLGSSGTHTDSLPGAPGGRRLTASFGALPKASSSPTNVLNASFFLGKWGSNHIRLESKGHGRAGQQCSLAPCGCSTAAQASVLSSCARCWSPLRMVQSNDVARRAAPDRDAFVGFRVRTFFRTQSYRHRTLQSEETVGDPLPDREASSTTEGE